MFHWDDILKMGEEVSDEELAARSRDVNCHEVTTMLYTSGTTGFPKGVMLTHHNILNNGMFTGDNMQFTPADRLLIQVPFFHCFGMILSILACVTHAATMIPLESFSPTNALKLLASEKCTVVHGVPTMFIFIMDHPDFKKYDLSHLRTGIMAGSNCPENLMRRCADEMNMKGICSVYGQTECSPNMTQSTWDDSLDLRVSTVGRATGGVEVRVVDPETGAVLPPFAMGEICSRGYHIMKGYYKMEEATRQAVDADGWLHTGDIGYSDENGYYRITGRIKDMIIRGGENIYPRELEELLYTHPKIQDVQVVGIPSKKFGEEVLACVILKAGVEATEEEIQEFMRQNISRHKVPSYVWFVDSFPMTASGKIQKFKLRETAVQRLTEEGIIA
jgi:fatty-acyl-CoA synthase